MSYSIPIHSNTQHTNSMPHTYHLYIAGCGGEVGLTPISDAAADYWKDINIAVFGHHILINEKPTYIDLDGQQLGQAQFDELNILEGPELHDGLTIDLYDPRNGQKVWGYQVGEELTKPFKHELDEAYYGDLKDDTSYVYYRTFDAVSNVYVLETYEPFDSALLELDFVWFSGSQILRSVRYDDREVNFDHQCVQAVQAPMASVLLRTMN